MTERVARESRDSRGHTRGWTRFDARATVEPGSDAGILREIDFHAVHSRLLPAWLIAAQRDVREGSPRDREAHRAALTALRTALQRDRNLDALALEIDSRIVSGIDANAERLRYLFWAWGNYLDAAHIPYRLEADVHTSPEREEILFRAYRVVADLAVRIAGEPYRTRILTRADGTNVRELYLGHASDATQGALVVLDRVTDFALQNAWPLFSDDPTALAHLDAIDRAHATAVRDEARAWISPAAFETLARTAGTRASLLAAVASVNARRACGSRLEILAPAWNGIPAGDLAALRDLAAQWTQRECPPVLPEEAESLAMDSARLASVPALPGAVAELTAWLARAVTAHEARHAADDRATDGMREPLECPECPAWLRAVGRTELSAYLAAMETPGVGYVSLYQACKATRDDVGPHVDAVALLTSRLEIDCGAPPPADLYARAAALEREYFARGGPVMIPWDFPGEL